MEWNEKNLECVRKGYNIDSPPSEGFKLRYNTKWVWNKNVETLSLTAWNDKTKCPPSPPACHWRIWGKPSKCCPEIEWQKKAYLGVLNFWYGHMNKLSTARVVAGSLYLLMAFCLQINSKCLKRQQFCEDFILPHPLVSPFYLLPPKIRSRCTNDWAKTLRVKTLPGFAHLEVALQKGWPEPLTDIATVSIVWEIRSGTLWLSKSLYQMIFKSNSQLAYKAYLSNSSCPCRAQVVV